MENRKKIQNFVESYWGENFQDKKFEPGVSSVPPSGKVFDQEEMTLAVEAVLKGWWTDGEYALELESKLKDFLGMRFCSLVNSGSSANLLAFAALTSPILRKRRIMPGDEVITVAAGFPTTINPILTYGCVPVFVDVDLATCEIDTSMLARALSDKTKAVFVAHTLGNAYNAKAIREFCDTHKLWFIEDNCDALGAEFDGKKTGTYGDLSTLSFYPAHHMTTGEGGAVFTNNAALNKIVRSIRDWGRDCYCPTGKDNTCCMRFGWKLGELPAGYDHKYIYSHIGYNLKLTDLQAAIGVAQIDKLQGFIDKRRENHAILTELLSEFSDYFDFMQPTPGSNPSWFGFVITLKDSCPFERAELMRFLDEKKIGTRLVFAGNITKQPYFCTHDIEYRVIGDLKNTDKVMLDTFWIGLYPALNREHFEYVKECFKEFLEVQKIKE